jgi:hypothetical protein
MDGSGYNDVVSFALFAAHLANAGVPPTRSLRLMSRVFTADEKAAAALRGTFESTSVTESDLLSIGIPKPVIDAVALLDTKSDIENCGDLEAIRRNRIARELKIQELLLNLEAPLSYDSIVSTIRALRFLGGGAWSQEGRVQRHLTAV